MVIQFDRQLRVYLKVWMVLGLAAIIYLTYQLFSIRQVQQTLADLKAQCQPVRQTQSKIAQDEQALTTRETKRAKLRSLQKATQPIGILAAIVTAMATQPGKVHLQRLSIQVEHEMNPPGVTNQPKPVSQQTSRPPTQSVVLMGQAADDAALSKLIQDLRVSGWLQKVELKSSSRANNAASRQFHVECESPSVGDF